VVVVSFVVVVVSLLHCTYGYLIVMGFLIQDLLYDLKQSMLTATKEIIDLVVNCTLIQ